MLVHGQCNEYACILGYMFKYDFFFFLLPIKNWCMCHSDDDVHTASVPFMHATISFEVSNVTGWCKLIKYKSAMI